MRLINSIFLFFFAFLMYGQELPPVINFGPNEYGAGNQNWMVSQGDNLNFYFANSTGLLEFNGEDWELYPVPNKTVVRSVKVVDDRVYIGAYMEAGYWERNSIGKMEYTSLIPKFEGQVSDGEQFWQIEEQDGIIIFRSFPGIYFYDPASDEVTKMQSSFGQPISGLFKVNDQIFFQLVSKGLYTIEKGEASEVIPFDLIGERAVMHLYYAGEELRIVTGNSEFFKWDGKQLEQFNETVSNAIGKPNLLAALNLKNGDLILGTVGGGIIQITNEGKIKNRFTQENILLNNTVLNLYLDREGKIWAGLDYGISMIEPDSAFRSFKDNRGEIGSVYSSFSRDGDLYLGTNQGLYLRKKGEDRFLLIDGTKGQVWFINEVGGNIFCGHNSGTFLIQGDKAKKINDRLGTWLVKEYKDDFFVLGHYNGLSFLKEEGGELISLPMLPDFPHSSKFIEVDDENEIWISNEHKGVFQIELQEDLSGIKDIKNYQFPEDSGINSSIFWYNDTLYYSSRENIYQYNEVTDKFTRDNRLNSIIDEMELISGRIISDEESKLWGFTEKGIFNIEPSQLNKDYKLNFIPLDQSFRNIAIGYENIKHLGNSEYLLGVANGYIKFELPVKQNKDYEIRINEVAVSPLDSASVAMPLTENGNFHFEHNNVSFEFSVPVYNKYEDAQYSYRLLGLSPNWSEWDGKNDASFENLPFGDYTFEVKARLAGVETESASYDFAIQRPFYLSNLALLLYAFLFILIVFIVHVLSRRHHKKIVAENERELKMKNLEAEREIIKLRNEKLEQDMANKNRELAVSTMSLIKKNEFLTSIKDQLKDSKESPKVRSVIKTIDKDISEEDNWKFFKKAFSNADKDFFKKIKSQHPDLTSNDLKLCAYLRLNLSSKEIAPLLNISVKSVEIKRYRLRKKMNLDRETNLTDYILSL